LFVIVQHLSRQNDGLVRMKVNLNINGR